jgi:hypothetical protein
MRIPLTIRETCPLYISRNRIRRGQIGERHRATGKRPSVPQGIAISTGRRERQKQRDNRRPSQKNMQRQNKTDPAEITPPGPQMVCLSVDLRSQIKPIWL